MFFTNPPKNVALSKYESIKLPELENSTKRVLECLLFIDLRLCTYVEPQICGSLGDFKQQFDCMYICLVTGLLDGWIFRGK